MKILRMVLYKLKMMFGDKVFFAAMVLLPLVISSTAAYAMRFEKLNVIPVAVVNEDNTGASSLFLNRLREKEGLRIEFTTREKSIKMIGDGELEHGFIIKEGFEDKIKSGQSANLIDFIKSPSAFTSDYVTETFAGEVMRLIANNYAANWVLDRYDKLGIKTDEGYRDEVINYADSQWEPEPLMTVQYEEIEGNITQKEKGFYRPVSASSAGVIIFFIMLYILFGSGWLVEERVNGTLKRLAAAPGALVFSYFSSIVVLVISAMLQVVVISLINRLIFGVVLFAGVTAYLVLFAYIISVVSISMFLSSVLRTSAQLQTGAPAFALLTGFVGGCFWDSIAVPERVGYLSRFTPQGWAIEGLNNLFVASADVGVEKLNAVIMPVLVLFSMSLILLPLSYIIVYNKSKN